MLVVTKKTTLVLKINTIYVVNITYRLFSVLGHHHKMNTCDFHFAGVTHASQCSEWGLWSYGERLTQGVDHRQQGKIHL